jgi:hypothetical protein
LYPGNPPVYPKQPALQPKPSPNPKFHSPLGTHVILARCVSGPFVLPVT